MPSDKESCSALAPLSFSETAYYHQHSKVTLDNCQVDAACNELMSILENHDFRSDASNDSHVTDFCNIAEYDLYLSQFAGDTTAPSSTTTDPNYESLPSPLLSNPSMPSSPELYNQEYETGFPAPSTTVSNLQHRQDHQQQETQFGYMTNTTQGKDSHVQVPLSGCLDDYQKVPTAGECPAMNSALAGADMHPDPFLGLEPLPGVFGSPWDATSWEPHTTAKESQGVTSIGPATDSATATSPDSGKHITHLMTLLLIGLNSVMQCPSPKQQQPPDSRGELELAQAAEAPPRSSRKLEKNTPDLRKTVFLPTKEQFQPLVAYLTGCVDDGAQPTAMPKGVRRKPLEKIKRGSRALSEEEEPSCTTTRKWSTTVLKPARAPLQAKQKLPALTKKRTGRTSLSPIRKRGKN